MTNREKIERLGSIQDKADVYGRTVGKLEFDLQCLAPPDGMDRAARDAAELEQVIFELTHSDEYIRLICELHEDPADLNELEKAWIEYAYEDYSRTKNQSPEFAKQMSLCVSKAYQDWYSAKMAADYGRFRDSFAELISMVRKSIDLRDDKKGTYYDTCLYDYEKEGSVEDMDRFFNAVRDRVIPLIRDIQERGKPIRTDFMRREVEIPKQEKMSRQILKMEGLRESALVLSTTEHPFTTNFGSCDVRVTTHYHEDNFVDNIFTTLHEGGHALFMQNEPEEFEKYHVADHMTAAMHECISRFFENLIGRSEDFIHAIYPEIQKACPGLFEDVSERELYEAVNVARPGLIRTEADELTYMVHILIRDELEKGFINGDISVDELPELWREKYRDYLGIVPENDAEGILQDMQWASYFGYFPSYALGSAYGYQILRKMKQEMNVSEIVRAGDLSPLAGWLKEHVFSCASLLKPSEWMVRVTGEPFRVDYYLDYLDVKFRSLYNI